MGETTAIYLPLSPSFSLPLSASLGSQLFRYRLFTMDNDPPTSDATVETQQEIPPFSPEQLVWIDRLIANRQEQSSVATSSPGTANPVVDPASSAPAQTSCALTSQCRSRVSFQIRWVGGDYPLHVDDTQRVGYPACSGRAWPETYPSGVSKKKKIKNAVATCPSCSVGKRTWRGGGPGSPADSRRGHGRPGGGGRGNAAHWSPSPVREPSAGQAYRQGS